MTGAARAASEAAGAPVPNLPPVAHPGASASKGPARRRRHGPRSWWRLVVLLAGALVFLFPFYYMIVGSLQKRENTSLGGAIPQPGNITLHNYGQINAALDLGRSLINSGIFTGGVVLATVVFGVLAGYALAKLRFRGRGLLFAIMLLLLVVPFQLLIIPLYVLIVRNYGLGNSFLGMIAPFAINSVAVFIFRQFFRSLPEELFDAARIDGASEIKLLTKIALPLVRPAMLTAVLLTFIGPWNEFLWPFLITKEQSMQPLAVALANYISTVAGVATNPFGAILAGAFVLAVPVVALFIVFQKHFISADIGSAVKG
jgi:multiple sugar transport system permease protein